jgi:vacuolar-type H+-ATPase subunit I/STV1
MARWFRSEPMEYISLIVNEDAAHDCLADLGKLGVIQFSDVSSGLFKSLKNPCKRVDAFAASGMPY